MLTKIKTILKSDYLLGRFMRLRYERRFYSASNSNLFYGIFSDFQSAVPNLPAIKPSGYDNEASAQLYLDRSTKVHSSDYPVLFWLRQLLREDSIILEIGGHIGVSFYAYDHFMGLGKSIDWTIHDVEAVAKNGEKIAKSRKESRLHFTHELKANPNTDIVFASGSLQYIESSLAELMAQADVSPGHVLVNLMPVNDKSDYFTINNIGTAFCVYKVSNEDLLIEQMAGYDLIDTWDNPNKRCLIPFEDPSYSLNSYKGFYFKKRL